MFCICIINKEQTLIHLFLFTYDGFSQCVNLEWRYGLGTISQDYKIAFIGMTDRGETWFQIIELTVIWLLFFDLLINEHMIVQYKVTALKLQLQFKYTDCLKIGTPRKN